MNQLHVSRDTQIEINGETKSILQWADAVGIGVASLVNRINNLGWTPAEAVGADPHVNPLTSSLTFRGETLPLKDMAKKYGLTVVCLHKRLSKGMSIESALTTPISTRGGKTSLQKVEFNGKECSLVELANEYKQDPGAVYQRIAKLGWTLRQALSLDPRPGRKTWSKNGERKCERITEERMIGQKFGRATVVACVDAPRGGENRGGAWKCTCECGREMVRSGYALVCTPPGSANGCGCGENRVIVTDEQKAGIISAYEGGKNLSEVAKEFSLKRNWVWTFLKKNSVDSLRSAGDALRQFKVNENAFKTITEQSAYYTGLLITDGNVMRLSKNASVISLGLQIGDAPTVKRFRDFISPMANVNYSERRDGLDTVAFRFRSVEVANDLSKLGVVPRKSLMAKVSEDLALNADFWRGAVDGDGSVKQCPDGACYTMLCGSFALVNQFADYCQHLIPGFRPSVLQNNTIARTSISGRKAGIILKALYGNATVAMERKHVVALRIIAAMDAMVTDKPLIYQSRTGEAFYELTPEEQSALLAHGDDRATSSAPSVSVTSTSVSVPVPCPSSVACGSSVGVGVATIR
jgi:predicted DNA-binding protein YlxM (UPF0122 family)